MHLFCTVYYLTYFHCVPFSFVLCLQGQPVLGSSSEAVSQGWSHTRSLHRLTFTHTLTPVLTQGTELGILSALGCFLHSNTHTWVLLVFSTPRGTRTFPALSTFLVSEVVPEFLPFLSHLWEEVVRTEHNPPGESIRLIYIISLWSLVCYSWSYSWWILMPC